MADYLFNIISGFLYGLEILLFIIGIEIEVLWEILTA